MTKSWTILLSLLALSQMGVMWIEAAPGGGGTPTFDQSKSGSATNNQVSVTFDSALTGDIIVVAISLYDSNPSATSVTDNASTPNTYTELVETVTGNIMTAIYVAPITDSSATQVTTTTGDNSDPYQSVVIAEFSDVGDTSCGVNGSIATSSSPATGTVAPSGCSGDLLYVAVFGHEEGTTGITEDWTLAEEIESDATMPISLQYTVGTGTKEGTWTLGASRSHSCSLAVLD